MEVTVKSRKHQIRSRATSLVFAYTMNDPKIIEDRMNKVRAPQSEGGDNMSDEEVVEMIQVLRSSYNHEVAREVVKRFNIPLAA